MKLSRRILFSSNGKALVCILLVNRLKWGAGVGVQGWEFQADNCIFSDNCAEIWGGGVASDFGNLKMDNCTFTRDTSSWGSSGFHIDHSIADLTNCTFEKNQAVFVGLIPCLQITEAR